MRKCPFKYGIDATLSNQNVLVDRIYIYIYSLVTNEMDQEKLTELNCHFSMIRITRIWYFPFLTANVREIDKIVNARKS